MWHLFSMQAPQDSIFTFCVASLLLVILLLLWWQADDPLRDIDSAQAVPIVGSAPFLPRQGAWLRFNEWVRLARHSKQDVDGRGAGLLRLDLCTQRFLLLTDTQTARSILNGRRNIYSGRPPLAMIQDSQSTKGSANYFAFMTLNNDFHRHKQAAMSLLRAGRRAHFWGHVEREADRMLVEMMRQGNKDARNVVEQFSARVITRVVYGIDESERLREEAGEFLSVLAPASYIVNLVPQLQWLPYFINPWKRYEYRRWTKQKEWFQNLMRKFIDRHSAADLQTSVPECFGKCYLEAKTSAEFETKAKRTAGFYARQPALGLRSDEDAAWLLGMLMLPGAYTVSSSLTTVLTALALFPAVQEELHMELDAYLLDKESAKAMAADAKRERDSGRTHLLEQTSSSTLPEESDAVKLPYFQAFLRECQRWRPVIPTGLPHQTIADDEITVTSPGRTVSKVKIPAGTTIFAPELAFCRDETLYPDPARFNVERWLQRKDAHALGEDSEQADDNQAQGLDGYVDSTSTRTSRWRLKEPSSASLINMTGFGWGERRCPGAHLAQHELHVAVLRLLAVFRFTLEEDSDPALGQQADSARTQLSRKLAEGEETGGMQWPVDWRESGMIPRQSDWIRGFRVEPRGAAWKNRVAAIAAQMQAKDAPPMH